MSPDYWAGNSPGYIARHESCQSSRSRKVNRYFRSYPYAASVFGENSRSPKMIQEPADRPHRLAVITDQPYPADDAAIPLLDDPHPRLLASCQQQHRQRMRRRTTNGKESRKIPQQVVQIRTSSAGTPSPGPRPRARARCATRTPRTRTTPAKTEPVAGPHPVPENDRLPAPSLAITNPQVAGAGNSRRESTSVNARQIHSGTCSSATPDSRA